MRIIKPLLIVVFLFGLGGLAVQPCTSRQTNLDCALHSAQDFLNRWNVELTWSLVALFGIVAAWGLWSLVNSFVARRRQGTWRTSQRTLGWWFVAIDAGCVALLLVWCQLDTRTRLPLLNTARAVEYVVPLVLGIQAALMFSLEDEPLLEVPLACQRPFVWILLERLVIVLTSHGLIGLIGSLLAWGTLGANGPDLLPMLTLWIPPALFFAGLGIYLTLGTRQPALSASLLGLLWFGMMFGFDNFLFSWPSLWPLHVYLQPTAEHYALNRLFILLLGAFLIFLSSRRLRDEEEVLLGVRAPLFSWKR